MRRVNDKDETRFDSKNAHVFFFQHIPTFTLYSYTVHTFILYLNSILYIYTILNSVFARTSANLNEIHEH